MTRVKQMKSYRSSIPEKVGTMPQDIGDLPTFCLNTVWWSTSTSLMAIVDLSSLDL